MAQMLKCSMAVAGSLMLFGASPAHALEGRTALGLKAPNCRFDSAAEGLTCKGVGGWKIAIGYHSLRRTIAFIAPGQSEAAPSADGGGPMAIDIEIGHPETAIWHGAGVIIPVKIVLPADYERMTDGTEPNKLPQKNILEVFRVGAEGSCTIAYVDAANAAADGLATKAAAGAADQRCPVKTIAIPDTLAAYIKE